MAANTQKNFRSDIFDLKSRTRLDYFFVKYTLAQKTTYGLPNGTIYSYRTVDLMRLLPEDTIIAQLSICISHSFIIYSI